MSGSGGAQGVRGADVANEARKSPQGQYVGASITDGEERTVSYRLVAGHPLVISVASSTQAL